MGHCHQVGHRYTDHCEHDQLWSAAEVQQQLEDSLRALQTDYVDLDQFHSGRDDVFDNQELWSMLQKQVDAGKVRQLGISVSNRISEHQVESAGSVGAYAIQLVCNRLEREPGERVLPLCIEQDLVVHGRILF